MPSQIHRKDWEWAMGIIAMRRFGKLNRDCTAIGVGAGKELVLSTLQTISATCTLQTFIT